MGASTLGHQRQLHGIQRVLPDGRLATPELPSFRDASTASGSLNRVELETYLSLLQEQERRERAQTRTRLLTAKNNDHLTPDVVADFACLLITDDYGRPTQPATHDWLWLHLMCNEDIRKLLIGESGIDVRDTSNKNTRFRYETARIIFSSETN